MTEHRGPVVLGNYRLLQVVATGGTSVLHRGLDLRNGTHVAVKVTDGRSFPGDEARKRMAIEAVAAQRLDHPHIVKILDYGEDHQANPILVMELLSGSSLEYMLQQRASLDPEEALRILLHPMDAAGYAHAQGVVHRDIKPGNIFISRSPEGAIVPKLLDFGIAVVSHMSRLTQSGVMVGTMPYLAPEQILNGTVNPQTDVWSMGVVLFRTLSGQMPHPPGDAGDLLSRIVREPARRLRTVAPHLGVRLCAAVDHALEHRPDRRYRTMYQFAQSLCQAAAAEGLDLSASVVEPVRRTQSAATDGEPTVALQVPPLQLGTASEHDPLEEQFGPARTPAVDRGLP